MKMNSEGVGVWNGKRIRELERVDGGGGVGVKVNSEGVGRWNGKRIWELERGNGGGILL